MSPLLERLHGIYQILDAETTEDVETLADAGLAGGVRLFQYRDKRGPRAALARSLAERIHAFDGILIVNDSLEAAEFADGVHIGQVDMLSTPIAAIRAVYPGKLIGVSAHTPDQTQMAAGADYFGVGPFRESTTKTPSREPLGVAGIAEVVQATTLPVCAIGGIGIGDLTAIVGAGVKMVAVVAAIAKAVNPEAAARSLTEAWTALRLRE